MGSVQLDSTEPHPIVVLNLSCNGAMIQAHEPPQEGAVYRLEFNVHRRKYDLPFKVIAWVQERDNYGWRGPFVDLSPEESQALDRAVAAATGASKGSLRDWAELTAESQGNPAAKIVIGQTPAGHDIEVAGADVLQMGEEGTELYARLMSELETM